MGKTLEGEKRYGKMSRSVKGAESREIKRNAGVGELEASGTLFVGWEQCIV